MFPVFRPESPQAQAIFDLFWLVMLISAGIFTVVAVLIIVALWRGRSRVELPTQEFGSARSEMYWMVGPAIVVVWIAAISANLILTVNAVPAIHSPHDASAEPEITVIGHQWWWEVRHHASGIVSANEIYIPVGKRIRVRLQSADVIHSFWVPQLARKMDAIPGRDNFIWLEANNPGGYQGLCSEFCGTQHAWMNFKVYALPPGEYAAWESARLAAPADPAGADATAGQRLFGSLSCVNCHAINGTGAVATIGPDLSHIASRKELAGGALENSPENLARWLADPQAIKPGCKMPNFRLTEPHVRQLVAYLETLE
ncbi:Cytochrome c oxidase subunit 2 precursor [Posidoniimonas corsicana]|uniref:Cytochrome c oxidase subunit 2 n=1 Tax=Posidoniimonas corsicana TaxID=1938618 RepID=A0A5C5VBQ6_9BACT|nr:cytochrome c oxidase subunit II [Posidoniimonas corsicana]TWT35403.1 Cytochrome c oxidase subunit 2 precursor [Posidoniimonas corsicana]